MLFLFMFEKQFMMVRDQAFLVPVTLISNADLEKTKPEFIHSTSKTILQNRNQISTTISEIKTIFYKFRVIFLLINRQY
jgi:hypothetical protein